MNRRKGVPCGCDADPCGCSPKNHCVKAINNVSPDPNGDFTIYAGTGIGILESVNAITIVNTSDPDTFIEGKNIEFTPSGDDLEINVVDDPVIDGTLTVNGDIIQNGAAYETHAEKVYTTNDYIVMRDGAIGGLAVGDYSGFQVEKYDGTNDGRLVIDRDGVARVGDVGDEQPLMTRDESGSMIDSELLQWDSTGQKAECSGVNINDLFYKTGDSYTTGSSAVFFGFINDTDDIFLNIGVSKSMLNITSVSVSISDFQVRAIDGKHVLTSDITTVTPVISNEHNIRLRIQGTFGFANNTIDTPITGFISYTISFN